MKPSPKCTYYDNISNRLYDRVINGVKRTNSIACNLLRFSTIHVTRNLKFSYEFVTSSALLAPLLPGVIVKDICTNDKHLRTILRNYVFCLHVCKRMKYNAKYFLLLCFSDLLFTAQIKTYVIIRTRHKS